MMNKKYEGYIDCTDQYNKAVKKTIRLGPLILMVTCFSATIVCMFFGFLELIFPIWLVFVPLSLIMTILSQYLSRCPNCGKNVLARRFDPKTGGSKTFGSFLYSLRVFQCWNCKAIVDRKKYKDYWTSQRELAN